MRTYELPMSPISVQNPDNSKKITVTVKVSDSKTPYQPTGNFEHLPIYQKLIESSEFTKRPFDPKGVFKPEDIAEHFIRGPTLYNPNCIQYGSSHFNETDNVLVMLLKLGTKISGHKGLVHGGFISGLFDEILSEAFHTTVYKKRLHGFTASLKVDYRQPLPHNIPVAIGVRTIKTEGRKYFLKAELYDASVEVDDGHDSISGLLGRATLFAEAEALFIIPKDVWEKRLDQ
ncbi:HotDog domain-containing protein [Globomyces pollinis-pini]|nr:HotDog domain-containing protein [Globomyces pollinis-pini]